LRLYDIYKFLALFLVSIFAAHFLPALLKYLFFWGLLIGFFLSADRHNHFWLIFFLLLISNPGYLFNDLPLIYILGFEREIFYYELFAIILILKAIVRPANQIKIFYLKPLLLFIAYAIFLLLMGVSTGSSIITVLKSVRYFIPLLLLFFIPRILAHSQVIPAIRLIFISAIVLIAAQLYNIVFGQHIISIFSEDLIISEIDRKYIGAREIYGPLTILLSFVISLFLIQIKNTGLNFNYLIFIVSITALSIFLSATRGWIISVIIIFIGYTLFDIKRAIKPVLFASILLFIAINVPVIKAQISYAFERTQTIKYISEGDLTAGGTLARLSEYSPEVLSKFYEKPVFGFGFSDEFYEYQNPHVGNETLLLNGGLVGYAIFLYFILYMIIRYYNSYKITKAKSTFMFIFGLLGLLIIHSSTRIIFSYWMGVETAIILGLFFYFSDFFLKRL